MVLLKVRRSLQIGLSFVFLITGSQATKSQELRCPPEGTDRATLLTLRNNGFGIEDDGQRNQFVLDIQGCLGSPDPVLRDQIAYEASATLLRSASISPSTLQKLRRILTSALDEPDPFGFRRPFAALILSEVARADRMEDIFTPDERQEIVDAGTTYLNRVTDYRGFDETNGWRHGVAHAADLMMQLVLNRAINKPQIQQILVTIRSQVAPDTSVFYVFGEPGRLARPVIYASMHDRLSAEEWTEWFADLASPAPFATWGEVYSSEKGLAKLHNTRAFVQEIYVLTSNSGNPSVIPLRVGALAVLEILP